MWSISNTKAEISHAADQLLGELLVKKWADCYHKVSDRSAPMASPLPWDCPNKGLCSVDRRYNLAKEDDPG